MRSLATIAVMLCATLVLASCQSPGQLAVNQQSADDTTCRSYGALPGTDGYINCRMNLSNQREAERIQKQQNYNATVGQVQRNTQQMQQQQMQQMQQQQLQMQQNLSPKTCYRGLGGSVTCY